MIRTGSDLSQASQMLMAYRELVNNHAWKEEIQRVIDDAREEHLQGCTAQGQSPEKRSEHIEAFHLAEKLAGYCATRIEELTAEIRSYSSQAGQIGYAAADAL